MRHRIKKIPTLSTIKRLLHSDKGTCSRWSINTFRRRLLDGLRSHLFLRPLRAARPSLRPCERDVRRHQEQQEVFTRPAGTYFYKDKVVGNNKRINKSYSGLWFQTIPLSLFAFVLLLVLGLMVMPFGAGGESVYAAEESIAPLAASANAKISFRIKHGGVVVADNGTVSTEVTAGVVNYINNTIEITTTDINKFYVSVQAADGSSVNLVGTKYNQEILPVGENTVVSGFGDNTWGYALSDNTSLDSSALTYNPLPAYSEIPPIQYISAEGLTNGTHTLALVFAAKINANKPADNYTTRAMVSVVADAKDI